MPLTEKGQRILAEMTGTYGPKKGQQVFYASKNKGNITGVEKMRDGGILGFRPIGMEDGGSTDVEAVVGELYDLMRVGTTEEVLNFIRENRSDLLTAAAIDKPFFNTLRSLLGETPRNDTPPALGPSGRNIEGPWERPREVPKGADLGEPAGGYVAPPNLPSYMLPEIEDLPGGKYWEPPPEGINTGIKSLLPPGAPRRNV